MSRLDVAGNWTRRSFIKGVLAGTVGGAGVGAAVALESTSSGKGQKKGVTIWSDEFNGPPGSAPDPAFWSAAVNGAGGGNREREYYIPSANALDGNGNLVITADRDDGIYHAWYGRSQFTSGKVWTQGRLAFRYGRLEVRAAFPCAGKPGAWPGIWLLGANYNDVGWPACGEIDLFESYGKNLRPTQISAAVHSSGRSKYQITELRPDDNAADFHVFTLDWSPTSIKVGVDRRVYFTVDKSELSSWPFSQPFFLILNLAIGGTQGGGVPPTAAFPYLARFDYVRLYGGELYQATGPVG